jgi:hypothetical protein
VLKGKDPEGLDEKAFLELEQRHLYVQHQQAKLNSLLLKKRELEYEEIHKRDLISSINMAVDASQGESDRLMRRYALARHDSLPYFLYFCVCYIPVFSVFLCSQIYFIFVPIAACLLLLI